MPEVLEWRKKHCEILQSILWFRYKIFAVQDHRDTPEQPEESARDDAQHRVGQQERCRKNEKSDEGEHAPRAKLRDPWLDSIDVTFDFSAPNNNGGDQQQPHCQVRERRP